MTDKEHDDNTSPQVFNIEKLFDIIEKQSTKNADFLKILEKILDMLEGNKEIFDKGMETIIKQNNQVREILTDDTNGLRSRILNQANEITKHTEDSGKFQESLDKKIETIREKLEVEISTIKECKETQRDLMKVLKNLETSVEDKKEEKQFSRDIKMTILKAILLILTGAAGAFATAYFGGMFNG